MTRLPADPLRLDRLIRAKAIHAMTGQTYRSVGVREAEILAVSAEPGGLDDLAGPATTVVDAGDLTVLPAFADAHEHLMEASRNTMLVPVDRARSVAEFTAMVAAAARDAAPGSWIMTSIAWHESNLAENRLPTGAELDAAAPGHPVLARRGGHLAIASSAALEAAGIGPDSPDPRGGKIGRGADGRPDGLLEGGAVYQVAAFAPAVTRDRLAAALGLGTAAYAALGVGTIREAMVNLDEVAAYQDAADRGLLSVRARLMIRVGNEWNMGSEMIATWGPERTRRVNPIDEWLAAGADLAAGTDIVRPFNPMTNVWGMATRGTKSAGIQGPEHAIGVAKALELYTMGTARLNGDADRLGSITPGKLADLVAYPADPLTADIDDLADLEPAFTIVGGKVRHDPDGLLNP